MGFHLLPTLPFLEDAQKNTPLIWFLKIESVVACLNIFGKVDQSLFPRKDIVSIPYVFVCTFGSYESLPCLRL